MKANSLRQQNSPSDRGGSLTACVRIHTDTYTHSERERERNKLSPYSYQA